MKATYQVDVHGVPADERAFLRGTRLAGNMSLKNAAEVLALVKEGQHVTLVAGVDRAVAEHVAAHLDQVSGCETTLSESTVRSPQAFSMDARFRFQWGPMRRIVRAKDAG
jgi:hypothetical protein